MSDTHTVKVGPKGRVVIPVSARDAFGIKEGDELVVVVEPRCISFHRRTDLLKTLRGVLRPAGIDVVDELIRERRAAALAEQ